jgi:hypothetical protein
MASCLLGLLSVLFADFRPEKNELKIAQDEKRIKRFGINKD